MTSRYFELGPDLPRGATFAGRDRLPYLRLAGASVRSQVGGDLLVSKECETFEELRDEILLMKGELDQALIEAQERYDSSGKIR